MPSTYYPEADTPMTDVSLLNANLELEARQRHEATFQHLLHPKATGLQGRVDLRRLQRHRGPDLAEGQLRKAVRGSTVHLQNICAEQNSELSTFRIVG